MERIAAAGHEIASHGFGHELLSQLTPDTFREDVVRSKTLLEQMVATEVVGYRAPSFSITDWAIPVLAELGFTYDSSFFPTFAHDRYGRLSGIDGRAAVSEPLPGFHEVSISCLRVGSRALPWGGGGYFRLLPYPLFRLGARRILETAEPYVFYIHPWEIDPRQPRIKGLPRASAFRHYVGLDRCETRFERLLSRLLLVVDPRPAPGKQPADRRTRRDRVRARRYREPKPVSTVPNVRDVIAMSNSRLRYLR